MKGFRVGGFEVGVGWGVKRQGVHWDVKRPAILRAESMGGCRFKMD